MPAHKRWLTVPKTDVAMAALDLDRARPEALIEWELEEADSDLLSTSGVLAAINEVAKVHIDDYEDTALQGIELDLAAKVVILKLSSANNVQLDLT